MADYEIWLTDDRGRRLAIIDYALGLECSRSTDKMGWFSLRVPPSIQRQFIDPARPDRMIQVWRNGSLWRPYFVRKFTFKTSERGDSVLIEGPDVKDLLRRRIVAAYSGATQASKTDYADDMMKEIVTEAIADSALPVPAAGTRVWANLSIAADLSDGPVLTKEFSLDPLFTSSGAGILAKLQQAAREAGTEVWFDVVPNAVTGSSLTLQFRTYTGQPGMDVSDRVVFDQEYGNLTNPELTYNYSEEQNYIYAAGKGEGPARDIQQVYDSTRYNQSIWGRCEGTIDARNQDGDGVRESGRDALEEGRPSIIFSGQAVDTPRARFGRDWDVGYRVKARYAGFELTAVIGAVTLSVSDAGESIDAALEYRE